MGFSGKFYILHCPSKVYLTSLMGKWMRVVEVSTFQLLLMNLTKLCTNFISTPQRTLPQLFLSPIGDLEIGPTGIV